MERWTWAVWEGEVSQGLGEDVVVMVEVEGLGWSCEMVKCCSVVDVHYERCLCI